MKQVIFLFILIISCIALNGQITIDKTTLPDIGDELEYRLFFNYQGNSSFKDKGENLIWTYDSFSFGANDTERFEDIKKTELADSFPTANILININGFDAAAIRSENNIEVIGLSIGNFSGFDVDASADFMEPFTYRTTPFTYKDKYNDAFEFRLQFDSDLIPGLDTIPIPLPGATLDSIRIVTKVLRSEEATAWGKLNLFGQDFEVLKVEQLDSTATKIEAGLAFFGQVLWIDVTTIIGGGLGDLNNNVLTYKFMTNGSKKSVLEFRETSSMDTTGMTINTTSGRMSSDVVTAVNNVFQNEIKVFPNPTNGIVKIKSIDIVTIPDCIKVYNSNGLLVKNISEVNINNVSLFDQSNGIYILKFYKENEYLGASAISLIK